MKQIATVGLSAFAAGYAASCWLDSEAGRTRRARMGDRVARAFERVRKDVGRISRDLGQASGVRDRDWTPAARLVVAASGLVTAAVALRRRSAFGTAAALGALTAIARRRDGAPRSAAREATGAVPAPGEGPGTARLTLAPG